MKLLLKISGLLPLFTLIPNRDLRMVLASEFLYFIGKFVLVPSTKVISQKKILETADIVCSE